ncbi:hypothetical protein DWG18_07050 [Lysobacter sp. TY2-98]|uniref:hypothetical protein n=1 Tax=Lysobacter sp. TY2-98 TaxID=2290922 RepID=UPI000E1FCEB8|nr:hypothetical protein [Lysobacter sp. TY2-98]AXK72063.1 hypothetical protein DWG18_07050 [Lysobacter sp. TY2-98]
MRNRWTTIVVALALLAAGWYGWQWKVRHDHDAYVAAQRAQGHTTRVDIDTQQRLFTARGDDGHMQRVDLTQLEMLMLHSQPGETGLSLMTLETPRGLVSLPYYGIDAWRVVQQLPPLLPGLDTDVAAAQLKRFEQERDVVCVLWASPAREVLLEKAGHLAGHCWQRPETP